MPQGDIAMNVVTTKEHPSCTVILDEMLCEFMYSNTEDSFNLTLPEKRLKKLGIEDYNGVLFTDENTFNIANPEPHFKDWTTNHVKQACVLTV